MCAAAGLTNTIFGQRRIATPSGAFSISERKRVSDRRSASSALRRCETSIRNVTLALRPSSVTGVVAISTGMRRPSLCTTSLSNTRGAGSPRMRRACMSTTRPICSGANKLHTERASISATL